MSNSTGTIKVILYKWKTLANGEHPLMLRVTKNQKRTYVSLGVSSSSELWDHKRNTPKPKHPQCDLIKNIITKKINEYQTALTDAKRQDKQITAEGLKIMIEHPIKNIAVVKYFDEITERLKMGGQVGNAAVYAHTRNVFRNFSHKQKREYKFHEVDYSVLTKFETWQRAGGVGENTLSNRFRTLRSLFNKAIKEGVAQEKDYPFKHFKVSKFKTHPNRRAITKDEIERIEKLRLKEGTEIYEARQIFLFTYYGHGINFTDIAKLKWSNIDEEQNKIFYVRTKTKKSKQFEILPALQTILDYWSVITKQDEEDYIFPILKRDVHVTPMQIKNRIHKKLTETNKLLKETGRMAGIGTPITTYVGRHAFAMALKRAGVSLAVISEAMTHQTESQTQDYLMSLDASVIDEAVKKSL